MYFVCLASFDFCQVNTAADKDRDPVENLGQVRGKGKGCGRGEGGGRGDRERSGGNGCVHSAGRVWRENKSVAIYGK